VDERVSALGETGAQGAGGARLRRVYERAQTSLPRVQASGEGEAEATARLQAQEVSLDPFELLRCIEEKL
jgi:hypothetical protein